MLTQTSAEENKAIVRRSVEEIFNRGGLSSVAQYYADNYLHHDPATPNVGTGLDAIEQVATIYRTAFPDLQFKIEELLADGDKVVLRWTSSGTHRGDLQGIAPTGKSITSSGITICRIADGRIAEEWVSWDTLGLMQQLGVSG